MPGVRAEGCDEHGHEREARRQRDQRSEGLPAEIVVPSAGEPEEKRSRPFMDRADRVAHAAVPDVASPLACAKSPSPRAIAIATASIDASCVGASYAIRPRKRT